MRKGLLSLVASTLLVSSAMADVNIATDGTGDYLVAPLYSTLNGYKTILKIMNTDNEHAYLVRGVLRRYTDSQEVVDFTIMLSPGDVWEAKVINDRIISTDDSNWNGDLNESIVKVCTQEGDSSETCQKGYVEFFVLAELNNNKPEVAAALHDSNYTTAYQTSTLNVKSIHKSDLKHLFVTALGAENALEGVNRSADLTYVVSPSDINNDAIGGYVTLSKVTHDQDILHTTLPLFAFEHTRENGGNIQQLGYLAGETTVTENYITPSNQTQIRNLLRYNYVSIPYDRSKSGNDAQAVFTFLLDQSPVQYQTRTFKQIFRDMAEKFPNELRCPEGQELVDYIQAKYKDLQDPSISPYEAPTCEVIPHPIELTMSNEVGTLTVSRQLNIETQKRYTLRITYTSTTTGVGTVKEETLQWNDVTLDDYLKGMYQVHNILNHPLDNQTADGTQRAAYLPTYFSLKKVGDKIFLNWNYAIRNR